MQSCIMFTHCQQLEGKVGENLRHFPATSSRIGMKSYVAKEFKLSASGDPGNNSREGPPGGQFITMIAVSMKSHHP